MAIKANLSLFDDFGKSKDGCRWITWCSTCFYFDLQNKFTMDYIADVNFPILRLRMMHVRTCSVYNSYYNAELGAHYTHSTAADRQRE